MITKQRIFQQMNCFRFAKFMNNATIINTFNSDNSSIAKIKTQHRQIMTAIANGNLKFEPMITKQIVADNTFFTVITFSRINSFT